MKHVTHVGPCGITMSIPRFSWSVWIKLMYDIPYSQGRKVITADFFFLCQILPFSKALIAEL